MYETGIATQRWPMYASSPWAVSREVAYVRILSSRHLRGNCTMASAAGAAIQRSATNQEHPHEVVHLRTLRRGPQGGLCTHKSCRAASK